MSRPAAAVMAVSARRELVRPGRTLHVVVHSKLVQPLHQPQQPPSPLTLVFVHGSMAHHGQFAAQVAAAAAHPAVARVVAYDAFGCGASDKPDAPDAWGAYAEAELLADLHALVERYAGVGVGAGAGGAHGHEAPPPQPPSPRLLLCGHSFGTNLALQLAAAPAVRPHVAGLVLIGAAPRRPGGAPWLFKLPARVLEALRAPIG
jgi:pimeloyl-ACP methyl ester carboxylesterase